MQMSEIKKKLLDDNFDKENQKISNKEKDSELREKVSKISTLETILEK
jgi:hypothetical protein